MSSGEGDGRRRGRWRGGAAAPVRGLEPRRPQQTAASRALVASGATPDGDAGGGVWIGGGGGQAWHSIISARISSSTRLTTSAWRGGKAAARRRAGRASGPLRARTAVSAIATSPARSPARRRLVRARPSEKEFTRAHPAFYPAFSHMECEVSRLSPSQTVTPLSPGRGGARAGGRGRRVCGMSEREIFSNTKQL